MSQTMRALPLALACALLLIASAGHGVTIVFGQGSALPSGGSYSGTLDTYLSEANPTASFGSQASFTVDLQSGCPGCEVQALLAFTNLFGATVDQIPTGATILSATLTLEMVDRSSAASTVSLYQMLVGWGESSTWSSLGGGVDTDGTDALAAADASFGGRLPAVPATLDVDVTTSLQAWASNPLTNLGWVLRIDSNNAAGFTSSEGLLVPTLTVTYVPEPRLGGAVALLTLAMLGSRRRAPGLRSAKR
jgi:hypothetical protein